MSFHTRLERKPRLHALSPRATIVPWASPGTSNERLFVTWASHFHGRRWISSRTVRTESPDSHSASPRADSASVSNRSSRTRTVSPCSSRPAIRKLRVWNGPSSHASRRSSMRVPAPTETPASRSMPSTGAVGAGTMIEPLRSTRFTSSAVLPRPVPPLERQAGRRSLPFLSWSRRITGDSTTTSITRRSRCSHWNGEYCTSIHGA